MKVLVMGGTQFNGLALVHELARNGHDATVCNRGVTPAELPAGVDRLVADRTDPAALRGALGGRDWDCVFDISAYRPEDVESMSGLLHGRVGHYVNLHHWNRSVFFSTERLRRDVGWAPEYSFPAAVAQTYAWMQREGLLESRDFDFAFEDELLAALGG